MLILCDLQVADCLTGGPIESSLSFVAFLRHLRLTAPPSCTSINGRAAGLGPYLYRPLLRSPVRTLTRQLCAVWDAADVLTVSLARCGRTWRFDGNAAISPGPTWLARGPRQELANRRCIQRFSDRVQQLREAFKFSGLPSRSNLKAVQRLHKGPCVPEADAAPRARLRAGCVPARCASACSR